MTLEFQLKKAVTATAIDILLKKANKSPKRCVRNLIELGENAYPITLSKAQRKELRGKLLSLCKSHEVAKVIDLFFLTFNCTC